MKHQPLIIPLFSTKRQHLLSSMSKLAIHQKSKITLIDFENILFCKADSNYTIIFLENNKKIVTSKCLKQIINHINSPIFLRIHSSYFVNLSKVNNIIKNGSWMIEIGKHMLPISRSKTQEVLNVFSY